MKITLIESIVIFVSIALITFFVVGIFSDDSKFKSLEEFNNLIHEGMTVEDMRSALKEPREVSSYQSNGKTWYTYYYFLRMKGRNQQIVIYDYENDGIIDTVWVR